MSRKFCTQFRNILFLQFYIVAAFSPSAHTAFAQEKVMAAIGDSISVGFNASRIGANLYYSWSTGDAPEVNSHKLRYAQYTGMPVVAYNLAVAGSVVNDLYVQIDRLASRKPDYTTVTIGGNDVCVWADEYAGDALHFDTTLRNAVQRLKAVNPAMIILLSPIPDMYNLWQVSVQRRGCQAVWDISGICPDLLGRRRTTAERQAFMQRWRVANEIIQKIADDYAGLVIHNPDLAHINFSWDHISGIDCYHPSPAGQALYSEKTWELFMESLP